MLDDYSFESYLLLGPTLRCSAVVVLSGSRDEWSTATPHSTLGHHLLPVKTLQNKKNNKITEVHLYRGFYYQHSSERALDLLWLKSSYKESI